MGKKKMKEGTKQTRKVQKRGMGKRKGEKKYKKEGEKESGWVKEIEQKEGGKKSLRKILQKGHKVRKSVTFLHGDFPVWVSFCAGR